MPHQFEDIMGPSASAEHQIGDTVRFLRFGLEQSGKLLHVRAPGPAVQGGESHPLLYIVDSGNGWPIPVPASSILWQK
jgi:hypothetical protein